MTSFDWKGKSLDDIKETLNAAKEVAKEIKTEEEGAEGVKKEMFDMRILKNVNELNDDIKTIGADLAAEALVLSEERDSLLGKVHENMTNQADAPLAQAEEADEPVAEFKRKVTKMCKWDVKDCLKDPRDKI
jgi:hypothetical protein